MKVRLLPLAVSAAIAMPGVALAEGPTVYGKLNVSYEMVDVDYGYDVDLDGDPLPAALSTSADRWELISNSSRLGVKGDAAVNDSLKAIYQIEFGLSADGDGSTWSNRDRFVGLAGNFGTFQVGNFDSPLKKSQGKVDQFNDLAGDLQYIFLGDNRATDILQYSSPVMGGFQANFAFMPGEQYDDGLEENTIPADTSGEEKDGPADAFSTSVTFAQDMIYAALAYDSEVSSTAYWAIGRIAPDCAAGTDFCLVSDTAYYDTLRLTGVLTLDALQLGAMYQMAETSDSDIDGDLEQDGFLLSASFKISQIVLKGQYGATTLSDNDADEDNDAEQLAFGVDYLLSKQTTLFGYYNMLAYEADFDGAEEQTKDNLGVGIVHNF